MPSRSLPRSMLRGLRWEENRLSDALACCGAKTKDMGYCSARAWAQTRWKLS